MADRASRRARAKRRASRFGEVDRAVLAAGAADRHGEVAALVAPERRQPALQERLDLRQHLARPRAAPSRYARDRRVAAGQRAQLAHVVRIRQHAHVEHVVGVERHAVLEREALEHQRQPAVVGAARASRIQPRSCAGRSWLVSITVETSRRLGEQLALELDRVDQRAAAVAGRSPGARPSPGRTADAGAASPRSAAPARRCSRRGRSSCTRDALRRAAAPSSRQQVRQRAGAAHVDRDRDAPVGALRPRGAGSRAAARAAGCRRRSSRRPRARAAPPTCPSPRCR